jgi:4-hydroxybenzoate polyprenyltransferase
MNSFLATLRKLLEMIRFSHTLFALPFALMAAVLAWNAGVPADDFSNNDQLNSSHPIQFRWVELVGLLVCMVGARSAAMAFNRLADRKIDAENPRTANRHLPSGQLSVGIVLAFTIASIALFFLGTSMFLPNWLPMAVSIPVLFVLLGYSYAKRFTSLAHFWLGVALMLAPICTWLAIRGLIVWGHPSDLTPALVLGLAVMFWVAGFDIIYACQDYEFDRDRKLNSIPVRLGIAGALRLASICHGLMVLCLCLLPFTFFSSGSDPILGWIYWAAILGVAGLLIYEHSLVRADDLTRVNQAFFNVNVIISMGLLFATILDLWLRKFIDANAFG